jgi:hypothetical protein
MRNDRPDREAHAAKPGLRDMLATSHVAAVAIAIFLIWSIDGFCQALWRPLSGILNLLATAVAILDVPYYSSTSTMKDRLDLDTALTFLGFAMFFLFAAWILSRWVYGMGPLRSLGECRSKLVGGKNA